MTTTPALDRARAGDGTAFAELTAPYRRELHVHCYRLLGSVTDADDLLQETLVAAWRGLDGFAGRSSLRTWLYRIATNRCLNAIRGAGRRREPAARLSAPPFDAPQPSRRTDVPWLQPYPDGPLGGHPEPADPAPGPAARYQTHEAVRLAFVAALQRLPPRQTATVVLCDVLGFSGAEAAAILDVAPTAVKGLLQRARAALERDHATPGAGAPPVPGSAGEAALAHRFADAFAADDVDAVVALLTDDAWLAMPPAPHVYDGPAAIAGFLRASATGRGGPLALRATRANGAPAFTCRLVRPGAPDEPSGLIVLGLAGDRIASVTRFVDPPLVARFDALPAQPAG